MILFFPEHAIRYAKIPKNACSTILNTLGYAIVQDRSPHQFDHHFRDEIEGSDAWPLLVVLRDPYERLVSAYLNKLVIPSVKEQFAHNVLDVVWRNQRGQERPHALASITFAEFVRYVCAREDELLDQHWQSQVFHLGNEEPDIVLDMDHLREAWSKHPVLAKIPLRNFAPHATKSDLSIEHDLSDVNGEDIGGFFRVAQGFPPRSAFLNGELLEKVRSRYDEDYLIRERSGL